MHAVLRGALGQAVRWGWIPTNPAESASPPKLRRREITPPGIRDTRALLDAADEHDPEFGAVLRVLAATGARRGEVCGLRWSDLDIESGTVLIRRSIASVAGGTVVKDTKTHAARRIALDPATLAVLARQRQLLEQRAVACAVEFNPDGFMFTSTADGSSPLHPDTITGGFRRLCDRLGLRGFRVHDLRHLHATQLLAAGVPVRTVSGRLGHADAATTLNVYARLPRSQRSPSGRRHRRTPGSAAHVARAAIGRRSRCPEDRSAPDGRDRTEWQPTALGGGPSRPTPRARLTAWPACAWCARRASVPSSCRLAVSTAATIAGAVDARELLGG